MQEQLQSLSWAELGLSWRGLWGGPQESSWARGQSLGPCLPPRKAQRRRCWAGLGRAAMGERAAPDPLFLPGPLISGGASFCLSPGPPFRSSRPPLPSSPQSLKGPGHTEVSGVRIPFTSSESRRCSGSLGPGTRSFLLGGGGCWQVAFPAFRALAALCLTRHRKGGQNPEWPVLYKRCQAL